MANSKEDSGIYHLTVGTEVSAKYRGAFCEAKIKFVKKNVLYKVLSKKTGKTCHLPEENIKGTLIKVGSLVECLLPDQNLWHECTIQNAKDRSSYTVIFDDGDERTLSRGSLCLKGDRHYAKSETLDNLPLTDPENFGTPVLSMKKSRSRRRPPEDEYDDESEDQRTPDRDRMAKSKEKKQIDDIKQDSGSEEEEDDDDKRKRWLADPLMGKVVIVEPNDKRKHWFPGLVVNPLCYERHNDLTSTQLVVRSFKTGKFLRVNRSSVKEMTASVVPPKLDSLWKGIVEDAQNWQNTRTVSDHWRIDIKDILSDSEEENSEEESDKTKKNDEKNDKNDEKKDDDDEKDRGEEKKNHDFLEILYKFMDDKGTAINKTPVLGYKDLDLYCLFKLVQKHNGSYNIKTIKEWKQIYLDLGIPKPNPAAGYNVRTAYAKYLGAYEEYCVSWKHLPVPKNLSSHKIQSLPKKEKAKVQSKRKDETVKQDDVKNSQDNRKIKLKEGCSPKNKSFDLGLDGKTRRHSPVMTSNSDAQLRRTGQRRRMSESSTASDVSTFLPKKDSEKKKSSATKVNRSKKPEDKVRNPGGPDSEPDEASRTLKAEKRESIEKKSTSRQSIETALSKRIRRNSTSSVSTQYVVGDKLKVKYGQGKTFKLYDAKILQKLPEGPGEATEYLVHYAGWNARHDELIKPHRIVGLAEDRSSVPSSPAADSGKITPRRPQTPISTRVSPTIVDDIAPSARLSVQLSSQFGPAFSDDIPNIKDDLPTFSSKPRVSSGLKKNLSKDFAKSASDSSSDETKRPTSPILVNSQRGKRPKSPLEAEAAPSPVTTSSNESEKVEEKVPESSTQITKEAPTKLEEKSEDVISTEKLQESENIKEVSCSIDDTNEVDESIDADGDGDTGSNSSCKSEEISSRLKSELSEDNTSDLLVDTPPIQLLRRTSNRRSKSPAYLLDSSWRGVAKRRKCSTSAENSPSPAESNIEKDESPSTPTESRLIPSAKRSRSPSPSSSTSSANSISSGDQGNDLNGKSPVLSRSANTNATKMADGSKAKLKRKSKKLKSENEHTKEDMKAEKQAESSKIKKEEELHMFEYDNFDEEAPSIALEKHKDSARTDTNLEIIPSIDKNNLSPTNESIEEMPVSEMEVLSSLHCDIAQPISSARKDEESNKPTKRKIRKRKATGGNAGEDSPKDSVISTLKTAKIEKPDSSTSSKERDDVLNIQSTSVIESLQTKPDTFNSTETTSSNNENLTPVPLAYDLPIQPIQPIHPPSSSKVLLDNTPPTTPEQSPEYVSEDQDFDHGNKSPMIDSDLILMDIGDEHKDSGGSSSSSGCEQTISAVKTVTTSHDTTQQSDNDNKSEDKEIPTPSSNKKRREKKTKRTAASKNQGNQRSSDGNDRESESDEEADIETGENNNRKRQASGSRLKPRKKRAKARPEPPSAPPPLPREELESMSQDERIALLQTRMAEMRQVYHQLKQEVANIDRKRKRAKRREKEAAEAAQSASKRAASPFNLTKSSDGAKASQDSGHLSGNASCGQVVTGSNQSESTR